MNPEHEENLQQAQLIVNDYGNVLASLDGSVYGLPESSLPHDKDTIKSAIHLLLWELEGENSQICESLAQAYIYLAQFIPDEEARIVANGQMFLQSSDFDDEHIDQAEQAARIINRIKLEMEALLDDVKAFMR